MTHFITYDLNRPGKDYAELHKAIKSLGDWWHHLDSVWLVDTNLSAEQIYNCLAPHIDRNDHLLVIGVGKGYEGWLPADAWTWIRARVAA